jgi:hypothetical protein
VIVLIMLGGKKMSRISEDIIKQKIGWKKLDDGNNAYTGFDFDARKDKNENIRNLELVWRFKEFLPTNNKYYILPLMHKGGVDLCKYDSIEDFINFPYDGEEIGEQLGGCETWMILEKIVLFSGLIDTNEKNHRILEQPITRNITKNVRYKILQEQKWKCNNCNTRLKFDEHSDWEGDVAHIDHIHPFADRATYPRGEFLINERSNLQGLCSVCNQKKLRSKN